MRIGIVGLPNVGKSSLFTALTKKAVSVSNYPFTTIDPNVGVVPVPDQRLKRLAETSKSVRIVPAIVEFVDIAGLVKGAHRGEGLGNQFLANIREVDAIAEVVRAFEDPEIIHVEGEPDALRDHEIIEAELIFKDLETVEKRADHAEKEARTGAKEAVKAAEALRSMSDALRKGRPLRELRDDAEVMQQSQLLGLLTAKPLLIVVNATDAAAGNSIAKKFQERGIGVIVANVKEELDSLVFSEEERQELSEELPALDRLIAEGYVLLGLMSFLTTGEKETRAWTIVRGIKAPQAAGVIHSDFEKKFIRADVIFWEKFIEAGGWANARAKGWVRTEGKEYVIQDGDTLEIKHG